jgi:hypothetical protein
MRMRRRRVENGRREEEAIIKKYYFFKEKLLNRTAHTLENVKFDRGRRLISDPGIKL